MSFAEGRNGRYAVWGVLQSRGLCTTRVETILSILGFWTWSSEGKCRKSRDGEAL